ncbi:Uncharacterised protein [Pseudomonas aeruginosa]|nr:Uncharacterised protein [Pseudomonas aeruginosa]
MRALFVGFPGAELLGGGEAVQNRHLAVHQHQVVLGRLHRAERLLAVAGGVRLEVELVQHAADDLGGDAVVLGDEDPEVARQARRLRFLGRLQVVGDAADAALGEFVGEGRLQRVAGHRLGQDALDPGVAGDDLARRVADPGEHDQQDVVVEVGVFLDLRRQLHAGHAGHVLVEQDHVEVLAQVRLGAQLGQRLLAGRHRADVQAPAAALLHQHLAAGFVVVHHQQPGALQRAVEVGGGVLQLLRVERQGQRQGGALAAAGLDAELPAHQPHQLAGDDQAEVAAELAGGKEVAAVQLGGEQRLALLGVERVAAVLHGDAQAWRLALVVEGHHQQDLAFLGLLERVVQQAQDHLAQARRIAADDPRHLRLGEADQLDALLLGLDPEDIQAVLDQRVEVELHFVQLDLPGLQLGDVEYLVDQREQLVAGAVDGLHVVALLRRQRGAEEQFGHPQHAVHGRADLVADLGQELGLGLQFRGVRRLAGALLQVELLDQPLAFGERDAQDQPGEGGEAEHAEHQPARIELLGAEQYRQEHHEAGVEHDHPGNDQARRLVAAIPVPGRDQRDAERTEDHQQVDQPAEPELLGEGDDRADRQDQQRLALQEAVQAAFRSAAEEAAGEPQQAHRGAEGAEVGGQRLVELESRQPERHQPQVRRGADRQRRVHRRQPQAAGAARVGEADQVVHQQQEHAAEQHAEGVGGLLQADQAGFVDLVEPGHQRMVGGHPHVQGHRLAVDRQREQVGARGQRALLERSRLAGVLVPHQLAVLHQVVVQVLHPRGEDPQPARHLLRGKLDLQPDRLGASGEDEGALGQRAELLLALEDVGDPQLRALVAQQAPVLVDAGGGGGGLQGNAGNAGVVRDRRRHRTEQKQQEADE